MKDKVLTTVFIVFIIAGIWLLTRPCSVRPFQNKSCWECGVEEGERQAIKDWNKNHSHD